MEPHFSRILESVEPLEDEVLGPRYRCALTLRDGTHLPCAILHSKKALLNLAKRRIKEELAGQGIIGGKDPYGQIVSAFVANGNRISDYEVSESQVSTFAPPKSLLGQIHGETTMGWTGWVFEMKDGRLFAYGATSSMDFLQLPKGYGFSDVAEVHNHSFVSKEGKISRLRRGALLPDRYETSALLRERVYFNCAIEGV
jgi:hypothetical protein